MVLRAHIADEAAPIVPCEESNCRDSCRPGGHAFMSIPCRHTPQGKHRDAPCHGARPAKPVEPYGRDTLPKDFLEHRGKQQQIHLFRGSDGDLLQVVARHADNCVPVEGANPMNKIAANPA